MVAAKAYQCNTKGCILGTEHDPGYFTSGMTAQQKSLKTGIPEDQLEKGKDYGEGICPECGKPAKDTGETFKPLVGKDEFAEVHEKVLKEFAPKIEALREKHQNGEIEEEEYLSSLAEISNEAQAKVVSASGSDSSA